MRDSMCVYVCVHVCVCVCVHVCECECVQERERERERGREWGNGQETRKKVETFFQLNYHSCSSSSLVLAICVTSASD